ncbi:MAG: hypothetical protein ACREQQ_14225 [Candidatus Binatia bacterium]
MIVAGYLVRFPLGGYVWQALHYLLGFERLGCEAFFYEDSAFYAPAYDPRAGTMGESYRYGLDRAASILADYGFGDRWVFWDAAENAYHGLSASATESVFASAEVFVNVAGVNRLGDRPRPAARIYLDIDPGVTQINLENGRPGLVEAVAECNLYFTFGENIGTERSPLPTGGLQWRPTRPPVAGDLWRGDGDSPLSAPFTTVGKWDAADRDLVFRGERFDWRKSRAWRKFIDLPRRSGERFELAMDVDSVPDDERDLRAAGWGIRQPLEVSIEPDDYRRYIVRSKGEFSAAKGLNVRLRSGWFSDRSVCYLAAGRPVVLEDTGFSDTLPTGRGLFAVATLEEAVEAFRSIGADYASHSAAAAEIAREHFAAERVLAPLLDAAGVRSA